MSQNQNKLYRVFVEAIMAALKCPTQVQSFFYRNKFENTKIAKEIMQYSTWM